MYEAYSEPCQTSKMLAVEHIFAKHSILDVWQGSEYAYRLERFLIWAYIDSKRCRDSCKVIMSSKTIRD